MSATNTKRTLDEPAIHALVTGLRRSGGRYYRLDETGLHTPCPVLPALMELGMCGSTAARLLKEATETGLIQVVKINHELEGQLRQIAKAGKTGNGDDGDDDMPARREPDQPERPFAPAGEARYELVARTSGWFGWFDTKTEHEEMVSRDREVALAEIQRRYNEDEEWRQSKLGRVNT
jgi:hypothetical protein